MATNLFGATSLTGGSAGSLDSLKTAQIGDGDVCFVAVNSGEEYYVYTFDSGNVAAESSPDVIKPDDVSGSEAWLLCDMTMGIATIRGTLAVAGTSAFTGNSTFAGTVNIGSSTAIAGCLDEDAMGSDSATNVATQQSIKKYIDDSVAGVVVDVDLLSGLVIRPLFEYNATDSIKIYSFRYHHNGTAETILKNDTTLTFTFGSGGSNANSDNLTASAWHYFYIDDSALSGTTVTAARLYNSVTAPVWNAGNNYWSGGGAGNTEVTDRCIGAFLTNGSSQLVNFFHDGATYIRFNQHESDVSAGALTTSATGVTLTAPSFSIKANVTFRNHRAGDDETTLYWNTYGGTGWQFATGDTADDGVRSCINTTDVTTDASQRIQYASSASTSNVIYLYTNGYYLPRGM